LPALATALVLVGCGPAGATNVPQTSSKSVHLDPHATCKEALGTLATTAPCPGATFVWGDLTVADLETTPVTVDVFVGEAKPPIRGYLLCGAAMEGFLRLQAHRPRFQGHHGGSADVVWQGGQLVMRRRWSAADVSLGTLDPPPTDVFNSADALAAIASCGDSGAVEQVFPVLSRLPKVFVFAMLPL
jgi:hypothetical protein